MTFPSCGCVWEDVGGGECVHGTVSLEDSLALLGNLVMGVPYIPTFH